MIAKDGKAVIKEPMAQAAKLVKQLMGIPSLAVTCTPPVPDAAAAMQAAQAAQAAGGFGFIESAPAPAPAEVGFGFVSAGDAPAAAEVREPARISLCL
jgi:hypothetical protein